MLTKDQSFFFIQNSKTKRSSNSLFYKLYQKENSYKDWTTEEWHHSEAPKTFALISSVTSYTVVTNKMRSYSTSILAHLFGIIALILMLVWLLHYREGIEYDSGNPLRVFNVCFLCFSSLIDCLFILNNCHILLYLIFSQLCRLTLFLCTLGSFSLLVKVYIFLFQVLR